MRIIAITTVFLDTLCWFFGLIGELSKNLKSSVSAPVAPVTAVKPQIALLIFVLILFIMNIITLIYLFRKNENQEGNKSNVDFKRIFLGIAWFAIIYFTGCFITGGIIGAFIGATVTVNPHEAVVQASHDFFNKYSALLLLGAALIAILGTIKGWLPFTKKDQF